MLLRSMEIHHQYTYIVLITSILLIIITEMYIFLRVSYVLHVLIIYFPLLKFPIQDLESLIMLDILLYRFLFNYYCKKYSMSPDEYYFSRNKII